MLAWTRADLAGAATVSERTIVDFERGARDPISATLQALQAAFERAGIEFIPFGVRLRPRE